jgi:SAM-dependent methyltransferase
MSADQRVNKRTDWDIYYSKPYKTASYSRKITGRVLLKLIRRYADAPLKTLRMGELGGANSCFFEDIRASIDPAEYHIIDNNQSGLDAFRKRVHVGDSTFLYNEDIFDLRPGLDLNLVFSVGLIEHFLPEETGKAIKAHLQVLKPDGIAIISFPTPTILYRITRFLSETLGLWIFHDERPLHRKEVAEAVKDKGIILFEKTIWPIFLTQRIMVIRNSSAIR